MNQAISPTILLLVLLFPLSCLGQSPLQTERLKKAYPESGEIYLLKSHETRIDLIDGKPQIYTDLTHDQLVLDKNTGSYNSSGIQFSGFQKIENIHASTLVPKLLHYKRIPVQKFVTKDVLATGVFHDDTKIIEFQYPAVCYGARKVLSYRSHLSEPRFMGPFHFSAHIPTKKAVLTITHHKDIEIGWKAFGMDEKKADYSVEVEGDYWTHRWVMHDVPKLESESSAPNVRYFSPHVVPYIKSYKVNGQKTTLLANVSDLHKWYYGMVKDINQSPNQQLKNLVDSLTQDISDTEAKAKKIYYWVQDNIKYVAVEDGLAGFIPRQASAVCDKRYGDCKDMASLITTMFSLAGLQAHLVWIGTDNIPYSYSEVPTPLADDHMIAAYKSPIDNQYHFLDATGKNTPYSHPTAFIQGKEAMINLGQGRFEIVRVPEMESQSNLFQDSVYLNIDGDLLQGNGNSQIMGYQKSNLTNRLYAADSLQKLRYLNGFFAKGNNTFAIRDINAENLLNRDSPLQMEYSFEIADYMQSNGDEIYLNLHLDKIYRKEHLEKNRKQPVKNRFKSQFHYTVALEIPNNYSVTYLPQNQEFSSSHFGFSITYEQVENVIVMHYKFQNNLLLLEPYQFQAWNEMIDELNQAYGETLIIKKKRTGTE